MTIDLSQLSAMLPEFVLAGAILGAILAEVLLPAGRRGRATALSAALGLLAAFLLLVFGRQEGVAMAVRGGDGTLLTGWRSDSFSLFVRALAAAGGLLTVLLSIPYTRRMDRGHGEFYALLLTAILGVMLVAGVTDFLSLFVCLELVTVSSYVLAAFKRNDLKSTEAGLKYLVIGALSSALLLFGIALVYGAVGDVSFARVASQLSQHADHELLLAAGLILVVIGILFKVGGVPFHVWIPDVYEGAPSPVTAFLSTGSKLAGMTLLLRLAEAVFLPSISGAGGITAGLWTAVLGVVAVVTLLFGILGAVPQRNFKRLLGYSSIGHAGYLLMGMAAIASAGRAGAQEGVTAILVYLLAFFFTNLTAFAVIVLVSGATRGRHDAASYSGLARRSPFLAVAMLLALLSLAGVPPLSGFFGKFLILSALVDKGLYTLALIGAAGVAVSLYFYLLWIREIYVRDPDPDRSATPIRIDPWARLVLTIGIVAMLGMGIFMGPFYSWAEWAARSLGSLLP